MAECDSTVDYIFVTVKRHPDSKHGETTEEGYKQARIIATNHGKTPATIIKYPCKFGVLNDKEADDMFYKITGTQGSHCCTHGLTLGSFLHADH